MVLTYQEAVKAVARMLRWSVPIARAQVTAVLDAVGYADLLGDFERQRAQNVRLLVARNEARAERDALAATVARVKVGLSEVETWNPYDTRDIGEAFLADSVRDMVAGLLATLPTPGNSQSGSNLEQLGNSVSDDERHDRECSCGHTRLHCRKCARWTGPEVSI